MILNVGKVRTKLVQDPQGGTMQQKQQLEELLIASHEIAQEFSRCGAPQPSMEQHVFIASDQKAVLVDPEVQNHKKKPLRLLLSWTKLLPPLK